MQADDPSTQLVAPLTGRPCLAYEVVIGEGHQIDENDATCLVLEQEAATLRVEGQRLDGAAVRLDLPRTTVSVSPSALWGFLGRRGLRNSASGLVICETILEPGDEVEIHHHQRGGITLQRATSR